MENIKITPPEGYEIDRENSTIVTSKFIENFDKVLTISDILKNEFGLDYSELKGIGGKVYTIQVRKIFMWLIDNYTNFTETEIARLFETNADHTKMDDTRIVRNYINSYNDEVKYNPSVSRKHKYLIDLVNQEIKYPLV